MRIKINHWWRQIAQHRDWLLVIILLLALVIRTIHLLHNPPSLYWEEMALLYDGWSIAQTGHDMHGQAWPLVAFTSFGDYKPSGYFYAVALLIKIFGAHTWAVRLPSVLAGLAIVYLTGKIAGRLFPRWCKQYWWWELSIMFLTAINPALMHLSRVGFETNLATAFFLGGVYFLLPHDNSLKKTKISPKPQWLQIDWEFLIGEIFLLAAFYTYHSMRVIAPLIGIYLTIWRLINGGIATEKWRDKKFLLTAGLTVLLAFIATFPFLRQLGDETVTSRFRTTSIVYDINIIEASNQCRQLGGDTIAARFWCHRYWYFGRTILQNFFSHFGLDYLFLHGDANARHSIQFWGIYYPLELIALFFALIAVSRHWRTQKCTWTFIIFWLLVGLIPASLTDGTPHLLRTLSVVPVGIILVLVGWAEFYQWWGPRTRKFLIPVIFMTYSVMLAMWLFYYFAYYPQAFGSWWQAGYPEAITTMHGLQLVNHDLPVYITRKLGRPSVYYFWYAGITPQELQTVAPEQEYDQGEYVTYTPDQVNFGTGWLEQEQLFILTPEEVSTLEATPTADIITDSAGHPVLAVGKYTPVVSVESDYD